MHVNAVLSPVLLTISLPLNWTPCRTLVPSSLPISPPSISILRLNRCVPTTWVLYGLGVSQLGDVTQLVSFAGRRMSVKTFVQGLFDYHYDMRWPCLAIMVAYVVFFRTASIMALRYLNFLRR